MPKPVKRKPGRPRLAEDQRKSRILKFRARNDLLAKLQQVAVQSGRSVSEEIEQRLAQSLDTEAVMGIMLGSPDALSMLRKAAATIETARAEMAQWPADARETLAIARGIAAVLLDKFPLLRAVQIETGTAEEMTGLATAYAQSPAGDAAYQDHQRARFGSTPSTGDKS